MPARRLLSRGAQAPKRVDSVVAACTLSCPTACAILVPCPGLEPAPPALQGRFLTIGPPGKSLFYLFSQEGLHPSIPTPLYPPMSLTWWRFGSIFMQCLFPSSRYHPIHFLVLHISWEMDGSYKGSVESRFRRRILNRWLSFILPGSTCLLVSDSQGC